MESRYEKLKSRAEEMQDGAEKVESGATVMNPGSGMGKGMILFLLPLIFLITPLSSPAQDDAAPPEEEAARLEWMQANLDSGHELYNAGLYEEALAEYRKNLAIREEDLEYGPDFHGLRINSLWFCGFCTYQLGDLDATLDYWEGVLAVYPGWDLVNLNVAHVHYKQGRLDQAISMLEEFLETYSATAGVAHDLAFYYQHEGDWERFYPYLQQTYRMDPSSIALPLSPSYYAAVVFLDRRDYPSAYLWFSRIFANAKDSQRDRFLQLADELRPKISEHPVTAFFLWCLFKELGDRTAQRAMLEHLDDQAVRRRLAELAGHPELEDFGYLYIGSCLAALGEVEDSIPYLKNAFGSSLTARAAIDEDPDLVLIRELPNYEDVLGDFDRLTMVVQGGHSSTVLGVDFSRDGRIVYTAGMDHTLRMWLPDGRLFKTLEAHTSTVNSVDVSPDGGLLATAGGDGSVKLWSADGGFRKKLLAHTDEVKSAVFSPDGSRIVSGGWDARIILWDIRGPALRYMDGKSYVNDLCYSPDGQRIVSGHYDGTIRIWSAEGELLRTLDAHGGAVEDVDFSVPGFFVSGSRDETLKVWDPEGSLLATLKQEADGAKGFYGACTSPDGRYIVGVTFSFVSIWDAHSFRLLDYFWSGTNESAAYSRNGILAAGNYLWRIDEGSLSGPLPESRVDAYREPLAVLGRDPEWRADVAFTADGSRLISAGFQGGLQSWKTDLSLEWSVQTGTASDVDMADQGSIALAGWEGEIEIRDSRGRLVKKFQAHEQRTNDVVFHPDGKTLVSAGDDHLVKLWSLDGTLLKTMEGHADIVHCAVFSPDGAMIASASGDFDIILWDASGKQRKSWKADEIYFSLMFSPDGDYLMAQSWDKVRIYSLDGEIISTLSGDDFSQAVLDPAGDRVYVACEDNLIKVYDLDGNLVSQLSGHTDAVRAVAFSPDGKYVASCSDDGTTILWNADTLQRVHLLAHEGEWIVYSPDGYFDSSISGGQLLAMAKGLEVFGVDQFALTRNRPDILLRRMGYDDAALISHFQSLYQKRLRKAGIKEEALPGGFSAADVPAEGVPGAGLPAAGAPAEDAPVDLHVPEVEITRMRLDGKFVDLDFRIWDDRFLLASYNVYVNDIPLYGAVGKAVDRSSAGLSDRIELTDGKNKIEVSCINERGAESYRALRFADFESFDLADLYFIGFGVSRYQDESLNLKYADKDVADLAELFTLPWAYRDIHVYTYVNEEVTPAVFQEAKKHLQGASVDDTLVVFIAGHGLHDSDSEATYYYVTHNADLGDLVGTCADFELIEEMFQGIAPRNKLFLMDTCESGEVEEDVQSRFYVQARDQGINPRAVRGFNLVKKETPSRPFLHEKNRYIYNNLARRSGTIVFSSSRGGEFSYEQDSIANGVFTEAILNGLGEGLANRFPDFTITVDELREYVSRVVAESTNGLQHPTVDRDNLFQKFGFTMYIPREELPDSRN